MGAWGKGAFDNDDARDWVETLRYSSGPEPLIDALEAVLHARGDLEAPEASRGLAAAEVVAALLGQPAATLPEDVVSWTARRETPPASVVRKARGAVSRILADSELKDLWAESGSLAKWRQEVEGLLGRLSPPPVGAGPQVGERPAFPGGPAVEPTWGFRASDWVGPCLVLAALGVLILHDRRNIWI